LQKGLVPQGENPVYDLFVSYHWRDRDAVEMVARELRGRGLKVFLDRWYLVPGQSWVAALEKVLGECAAAAIFLGPFGMGRWQQREMERALDRQTQDGRFPVIPILLAGSDPALGFLGLNTWVDLRQGSTPDMIEVLVRAARGQPPGDDLQQRVANALATICPYRGLSPFREEDEPFFCGRESFTKKLVETVAQRNLIAVVGASGSGKSSVVRAGLVPALRRGHDQLVWDIVTMLPQDRPFHNLAACFLPLLSPDLSEVERLIEIDKLAAWLAEGKNHLRDAVRRTLEKEPGTDRLLLVVDQWEELYTLCRDDGVRQRFMQEVLDASANGKLTVVLTLRGDFYGRALSDRMLSDRLQDGVVNIGPMEPDELLRAIVEPAKKVGLRFEEGLDERILDEVRKQPGSLPLLEFLLTELWAKREAGMLLHEAYDAIGGVRKAIAERAERTFGALAAAEQEEARWALLQLVQPGENAEDTRRRASLEQLTPAARGVIAKLATERLLVTTRDPTGREVVEVGHEALIREWGRLRRWVDENRELLRISRRLEQEAEDWKESDGSVDLLLQAGRRLSEAEDAIKRNPQAFGPQVREFVEASQQYQQRVSEQRHRQKLRRSYIFGAAAMAVLGAVLVVGLSYYNYWAETRTWAHAVHTASGKIHPLSQDSALVGRPVEGMQGVKHHVPLELRRVSRVHLSISRRGDVMDWRSTYGTTVNAGWLPYGSSTRLEPGDIVVLAGLELLQYRPIQWRFWHVIPHILGRLEFSDEVPLEGWAALVDGARRRVQPLVRDEHYVILRDGGIELSEKPTEDAVLIIRRRTLRERSQLAMRPLEATDQILDSAGELDELPVQSRYHAFIHGTKANEKPVCPITTEMTFLTLEALPAATERISGWIKEHDYHLRQIVLPANSETAWITRNGSSHLIGEISFFTEKGWFQVVPTQTATLEDIEELNRKCVKDLP
jgi:KaiC/GvpD/RAD55 family RecA-like ATPase